MNDMMPLSFSVVTPSFNQAEFIEDTIRSVLDQKYPAFEHIVIDGGSTDGTVELLRRYPHIKWLSEPDRGQSDALNKGLQLAKGDIIAWINSDDWYAPDIFATVARELETHAIIVGGCRLVDRNGQFIDEIRNLDRDWFDILRYWCSYAVPTQPSMFFRRELLESCRRLDGTYLDESLCYTMDYDLWLRFFEEEAYYRTSQIFAYYRMYEDNKTGGGWEKIRREMSRVFKRHVHRRFPNERRISFILETGENTRGIEETLRSLSRQTYRDFDVLLLATPASDLTTARVAALGESLGIFCRLLKTASSGFFGKELYEADTYANAEVICWCYPGQSVPPDFALALSNLFVQDKIGVALVSSNENSPREAFFRDGALDIDRLFSSPDNAWNFAVRKAALLDIKTLSPTTSIRDFFRELILMSAFKGWELGLLEEPKISGFIPSRMPAIQDMPSDLLNAFLVLKLHERAQQDTFYKVRLDGRFDPILHPSVVEECRKRVLQG